MGDEGELTTMAMAKQNKNNNNKGSEKTTRKRHERLANESAMSRPTRNGIGKQRDLRQ